MCLDDFKVSSIKIANGGLTDFTCSQKLKS